MPSEGSPGGEAALTASDVRHRATSGAALLVGRGVAIRALGFVGTIVLARLLVPADFGAVAIGSAIVVFINLISDGGLGAALIRGDHAPSPRVFEELLGLQLTIAVAIAIIVSAAAPLFGRPGWVAAIMTASVCAAVFGTASTIHLERNLMFRRLATIDVLSSVSYMAWAIPAAALGTGVWALASASVVQVLVSTGLRLRSSSLRVLRPRLGLGAIAPLLPFGTRFQAINAVNLVRDQGLNVGIAAVAGIGTLGVWSLAYRFIQVPFLLFESLWRVTFPGMARLIEAGGDARQAAEQVLTTSSVATAAIMCALVGSTPALIPAVFDPKWHGIVDILPWACGGLLAGGPISVAVAGFLFAQGDASTVLRGAVLHTAAALLVGLTLLPVLGVTALGLSTFASAIVEGGVLGTRAIRTYQIRIFRPVLVPTLASLPAGAIGWLVAEHVGPLALGAVAGATAGLACLVALQATLDRAALLSTLSMVTRTLEAARG
ncbi:MAG: oligosaccharide flippase family protein [Solirubrobacteraceae bacterium]